MSKLALLIKMVLTIAYQNKNYMGFFILEEKIRRVLITDFEG